MASEILRQSNQGQFARGLNGLVGSLPGNRGRFPATQRLLVNHREDLRRQTTEAATPAGHPASRPLPELVTTASHELSHELKGSLTPIIAYAEMLTTMELSETEIAEMAAEILRSSQRMNRLVDDLPGKVSQVFEALYQGDGGALAS